MPSLMELKRRSDEIAAKGENATRAETLERSELKGEIWEAENAARLAANAKPTPPPRSMAEQRADFERRHRVDEYIPHNRLLNGGRDNALAIQAWFQTKTHRVELDAEQQRACRNVGLDPKRRDLELQLLDDTALREVQGVYQAAAPLDRKHHALRATPGIRSALSSQLASSGGAIAAPDAMMAAIEANMLHFGGILQVADIIRTPTRGRMPWPTMNDTANKGRRIAEGAAVNTVDPSYAQITLDAFKYTSDQLLLPFELLTGTMLTNLPAVIGGWLGERIGRIMCDDFTYGTGASQPKGIIPSATTYAAASATAITWTDLQNLVASVDPAYREDAVFMFHESIRAEIAKLVDGQGRPQWNQNEPTLLGFRWFINQSMDSTMASGKKTVLFGQASKYKVRQVNTLRVLHLAQRHRLADQDGFIAFLEADGGLLHAGTDPVKVLSHT